MFCETSRQVNLLITNFDHQRQPGDWPSGPAGARSKVCLKERCEAVSSH